MKEAELKKLGPKEYSPEEISKIVRCILERYTQELQQRDAIVFEENLIGDKIHLTGKKYYLENLMYVINGENYIVLTQIDGSNERIVYPYKMTDKGSIVVDIIRESQDGQKQNFARCIKDISKEDGDCISCYMRRFILSYFRH